MAYDIIGNVTDKKSGEPLAGVVVVDVDSNGNYTASTTTDANGYYAIKPQNQDLTFQLIGYYDKVIDLTALGGNVLNLDVNLDEEVGSGNPLQIESDKSKKKYVIGAVSALVFMTSTYLYGKKIGMDNKILAMSTLGMGALGYLVGSTGTTLISKWSLQKAIEEAKGN
jgi:hypothetical protein